MSNNEQINTVIIGVDVAKDKLDICILPTGETAQVCNKAPSIQAWLKHLTQQHDITLVVFESTGGYEKRLMRCLTKQAVAYHRAHPNRVYHFAKAKGYFAKTDKLDARTLALYGQQGEITACPISEADMALRELASRKAQLKCDLERERHRLGHDYFNKQIKRSIKRQIKQLTKEIACLDKEIDEQIKADEDKQAKREILQTMKGVGKEVSQRLITQLPELGQLNREKISRLVGVAPCNQDSGKREGYRAIGGGRGDVRRALYMAALVAVRWNDTYKVMYERLIARGKKKKVAIVAVMRKMLITLNTMVRDNVAWQAK